MWNRQEIKARGKDRFRFNYWRSVLVALLISVIGGSAGAGAGSSSGGLSLDLNLDGGSINFNFDGLQEFFTSERLILFMTIFLFVFAFAMVLNFFVLNPLMVGAKTFFLKNTYERASLGNVGAGFRSYGRVVNTMFFRDLFLILWSLLFIIPGIIKSYSYRMVPYILAEHPEMSGTEVITMSRQMMNGHKWRTFVFDLSFIPWLLLSGLTLGVVGIFYVEPYRNAADAELYQAIKMS